MLVLRYISCHFHNNFFKNLLILNNYLTVILYLFYIQYKCDCYTFILLIKHSNFFRHVKCIQPPPPQKKRNSIILLLHLFCLQMSHLGKMSRQVYPQLFHSATFLFLLFEALNKAAFMLQQ